MVVWGLSLCLNLSPLFSLSSLFSPSSVERSRWSFTLTLTSCVFFYFFFTFCKLKEKQTKKTHKKDFVNKILTFCSWRLLSLSLSLWMFKVLKSCLYFYRFSPYFYTNYRLLKAVAYFQYLYSSKICLWFFFFL